MDRFLEEQEVELSQVMIPQPSDLKLLESPDIESKLHEELFNTGKTTVLSSPRNLDRSPLKSEQHSSKRNFSSTSELNGNTTNSDHIADDFSSHKASADAHEPPAKKNKLEDFISPDTSSLKMSVRNSSPLPPSLPPPALCEATTHPESAAESGNDQAFLNQTLNNNLNAVSSNSTTKSSAASLSPEAHSTDNASVSKDSLCLSAVSLPSSMSTSVSGGGDTRATDICIGNEVSAM